MAAPEHAYQLSNSTEVVLGRCVPLIGMVSSPLFFAALRSSSMTNAGHPTVSDEVEIDNVSVDLLVVGSGTGMAAALSARESGMSVLIVEKSQYVGGSTARSGGALWFPASSVLAKGGARDSWSQAETYLGSVVDGSAEYVRSTSFLVNLPSTVAMLGRTTPLRFFWAKDYADYHPEEPGGSPEGRTCECKPLNLSILGKYRRQLRPGVMEASLPMPTTGADYRWLNLMAKVPSRGLPIIAKRLGQGLGGLLLGRRYAAGGQALAAGLFAGVLRAGIPVWINAAVVELITEGSRVTGAIVMREGQEVCVSAKRGVVLAAGGFDHDMEMRHRYQSASLGNNLSLGADSNTGDAIRVGQRAGAAVDLMNQSWWFPAVAPVPGGSPKVMLAERSLPGSLIVDQDGERFVNEAIDYMSFGQRVLEREQAGDRVDTMWFVFDQQYRNSYVFAAELFPRMPIPQGWYEAGIACQAATLDELAVRMGVPQDAFLATLERFNKACKAGLDSDFARGQSAYDRYYGDPTVTPNPNLRPLERGPFYAVKMVLSDLGTCGGLRADGRARVLRADGSVIYGLYAIGNAAANAFGATYPGAGATIAQGLVYGHIAAQDAAGVNRTEATSAQ
ncbi:3-ketosteroid-delta-1-dehydrogenase [Mycobacteroides abscessus subsp. bolletii BD]|nr:3-ketosteroid-delta-1-dehydrogenase [Mycobacteroides abscessus subsp. bolletii BD]